MKVKDIAEKIEQLVPLKLALDWDNAGLLVGDAKKEVDYILLTIDVTSEVLLEAKKLKTDLIISYHPVIWDGLKNVTSNSIGGVVFELIRCDIAVFSIHTALDIVKGGVNDALAEIVGISDGRPIGNFVEAAGGDMYKLVVFIPVQSAEKVSNAIFQAGAGMMGNYSHCGFMAQGKGSFFPLEGARPAIGKKGRLEKVTEMRFETIVPADRLNDAIMAMKKAHPYEVPAYDCFKLYNERSRFGLGRIGKLKKPTPLEKIIAKIKKETGAKAVGIVGKEKRLVRTAAVCAGSCGKIINQVIAAKADLYLTGELKHHHALAAQQEGITCLCLSHTVSERFMLKKFAKRLQKTLGDIKIRISRKDEDPFKWIQL